MNDLLIIIKREYLCRIRRRSFLIMTILTPILIGVATIIPSFMMDNVAEGEERVLVFGDVDGYYTMALQRNSDCTFVEATDEYMEVASPEEEFSAMLYLPDSLEENPNLVMLVANYELSNRLKMQINDRLTEAASIAKYIKKNPAAREIMANNRVEVHCQQMQGISRQNKNNETAVLLSIATSFLLYIFIFSYGTQVMRGVNEEKSNKIMEVMFLSTRPTHFMAGKIIGIALMGLTQFAIWALAGWLIVDKILVDSTMLQQINELIFVSGNNLALIGSYFILFFLAGYLLYASLFASIGALSDPNTDTQQFFLPVTLPILFSIYAGIYTACHPECTLGVWCSYIPFTSPIVMLTRICYGIDTIEVVVSLLVLIGADLICFWLAGKIYRSAMLLHGKRLTYKDLWKFCTNKV